MLAFIDIFNKIGSQTNVLERKKLKSRNPESPSILMRYRRTYLKIENTS